ncbi:YggU family protein [Candidatus Bathyarchaeota archaeon]|nr:YggU family protein [Candidatus Bathyarchaeota archaeon]
MKIRKIKQGVILEVYVKPRSKEFKIVTEGEEIIVFCREEPVKGKVNKELVKQLSRLFHRNVKLVSGFTSKQKKVLIEDAEKTEIERVLLRK